MVLRGNGYNNEDKDRCDEFFQSLLSPSFSKRLLVTRPQHLLTVHFRYGFHALHYSCHISLLFSIILFLSCEKCGKESTFNSHLQSLRCGVHNPHTVWYSPTCRLLFFIFTIVFIVKVSVFSFFMLMIFLFCCWSSEVEAWCGGICLKFECLDDPQCETHDNLQCNLRPKSRRSRLAFCG